MSDCREQRATALRQRFFARGETAPARCLRWQAPRDGPSVSWEQVPGADRGTAPDRGW